MRCVQRTYHTFLTFNTYLTFVVSAIMVGMHIHIDIPRPYLTLAVLVGVVWTGASFLSAEPSKVLGQVQAPEVVEPASVENGEKERTHDDSGEDDGSEVVPLGGELTAPAQARVTAEKNMRLGRIEQAVLEKREEIMRYQLQVLEEERRELGPDINDAVEEEFRDATRTLTALLQDKKTSEQFLLESLNQLWEAEGKAITLGKGLGKSGVRVFHLKWPVDPSRGISAHYLDAGYKKLFGFEHKGLDIRIPQGSVVRAGAAGTIRSVKDNGLGFNSVTIQHEDGFVTLYGHLSAFTVQEEDIVRAGQQIGLSGGRPGSPGAGFSTGPHLHLEVTVDGVHTDPEEYLPAL